MVRKAKEREAVRFFTQQEMFQLINREVFDHLPADRADLLSRRPRSAEELTAVFQMLRTLGVLLYSERAQLVRLQPTSLPQVSGVCDICRVSPGLTVGPSQSDYVAFRSLRRPRSADVWSSLR